jgi:phosphoglycerol transferase MdoB-like AlkP superfamily enzyme
MNKRSFRNITSTVKIYLLALLIFSGFRLCLFMTELLRIDKSAPGHDIFISFFMGLRFDLVICSYIMLLPFVLLTIDFLYYRSNVLKIISFYYTLILFSIAFLVCAADIPWFHQFYSRFSVIAFQWAGSPLFVMKMIFQEPRYWIYSVLFVVSIVLFYKPLKNIIYTESKPDPDSRVWVSAGFSVLFFGLMVIGIRGRVEQKSPILVGTAYFCNNSFLNQLGLNPNFTFIQSLLDNMKEDNKPVELMDEHLAIANVQTYFGISNTNNDFPLSRKENMGPVVHPLNNVIIIIMESMSAAKMERHGCKEKLTSFLDSISREGYYFENAYTAGIHTFNGIFSTLFSFPALFTHNPMKESSMFNYHGIASALKKYDYSTIYFTTHDGQFDNVEGFLKANDFERVVSINDYPAEQIKTTLGVPDDFMFEFSIPLLNDLHRKGKPFLSVFMTASDHGPYYIPDYFKPRKGEVKNQIVEFADFSLKKFLQLSAKQSWFSNTLFVFVADHGALINASYDLSLDYNHTPLIFYAPHIIKNPEAFDQMAGQIDIYPSIMGLLGMPFVNNTLGINLFKENRPYIYFNADDKYGVIDETWLLIVRKDKFTGLYRYRGNDLANYSDKEPGIVSKMKTYAESNLQVYQYLLKRQKI